MAALVAAGASCAGSAHRRGRPGRWEVVGRPPRADPGCTTRYQTCTVVRRCRPPESRCGAARHIASRRG